MSEDVTLRRITDDNEAAIRSLSVSPGQEVFVASVDRSLEDARNNPGANPWFRAIYAGDEPVGFVMLAFDVPPGDPDHPWRYYLWRLLIDARYQRRGFGRAAMAQVIDLVRRSPGGTEMYASVHPGEAGPLPFYRSLGFERTGGWVEDEEVIRLTLRATEREGRHDRT
jgi:diamine N-acetyltransferase